MALTAVYLLFGVLAPIDPNALVKYNITVARAHLLTLTIVIPIIAIWLTALYGLLRFLNYAKIIEGTREGPAFKRISLGITLLGFSLPMSGVVGSILGYFSIKYPGFSVSSTIVRNYVNLILPAAGLLVIDKGATELIGTLKRSNIKTWPPYTLPGIIALSSFYTWLITTRPFGQAGDTGYFLPNWILLTSLAIPYLYVWCRGILAAYKFYVYKRNIKGVLYKRFFDSLSLGIGAIIFLSILTQFLTTLSARLIRLNLTPILLIIYVLVALNALGYGFIARGANRLKQIEEV